MLCDACHTALRLVYERKADDLHDLHIEPPYPLPDACRPYSSIIYPTPRSLYTALVAGCLICRMIWTLTLANKVDSQFNTCQLTQRALESNRPKTFEEFSDQYAVFEDDSQFAPGLPKDAEAATERNEPGTAILDGVESSKRSRKASHKWSETSPWAVLRIFSFPENDVRDWHSQSSMMGSVYRNSRCNIAATWASDSNDGCFSERDPSIIDTSGTLIPRNSFAIDFYMTLNDLYDIDILQAPLNKRAWVVQERYLARRQLNFSKHQVYWECLELTASEQNPTGWETCSKTNKPTLNPQNEDDFNRVWPELVEYYSNCTATVRSDRMVALAGLASEFRIASRDEYLAGLWKTDLRRGA
ncbi:hypothetical protein F5Y04DRAFT_290368 [Hypomontagnella monticulosa]|nr:hypothetical protein F5Y04DRAFT_290368 [Hypomontagnella monticulosa]